MAIITLNRQNKKQTRTCNLLSQGQRCKTLITQITTYITVMRFKFIISIECYNDFQQSKIKVKLSYRSTSSERQRWLTRCLSSCLRCFSFYRPYTNDNQSVLDKTKCHVVLQISMQRDIIDVERSTRSVGEQKL